MWPGIPLISLLVAIQVLNGILLPVILAFMLLLAGDPRLMGKLRNTTLQSVLGWGTLVLVAAAVLVLLFSPLLA
jgi:Mn2+/Fe2+ NRAMP family transporter